ncbi:Uncharacterised protein [Aerococcus viridans]|uniref:Type I restriction endonuclease subunit R n=2 Tax=Aerococcus viridans TaxID=1377 RepID=A0AAU8U495_9LACT|nr:DUF4298 domain-containing protein [Aerococcus viridans]AMC00470.1 type I restriction endonuclease subunit R [Aerococcus viridans]EFG49265.1 hypothetical protein HMPREF0061_1449 [Aerococcus viridans ATCC 11563 = CCUG 4311]SUU08286.1 Uncharacterised protein [Aerococcus viridans]
MKDTDNFYEMEENFLKISKEIEAMSDSLENFEKYLPNIKLFLHYYGSETWFKHLKMKEQGLFEDARTTAVLGEDYSYDLVIDIMDLANKLKSVGDELTEK